MTETPGKAVLEPGAASRWLIAGGVVLLATVVNFGIQGVTHNRVPFLPYFPVLVFVGVYSGTWPALISLCTSALLAWYFWFPSAGRAEPLRAEDGVALLLFFLAGGVVISISVQARALIRHLRSVRRRPFAKARRNSRASSTSRRSVSSSHVTRAAQKS